MSAQRRPPRYNSHGSPYSRPKRKANEFWHYLARPARSDFGGNRRRYRVAAAQRPKSFISAQIRKRMGYRVQSIERNGTRVYRILADLSTRRPKPPLESGNPPKGEKIDRRRREI